MKTLSALVTGSAVTVFLAFSQPLDAAPGGSAGAAAGGGSFARASGGGGSAHASGGQSIGHASGGRFFGGSRGGFAHGWRGGGGHWHQGFWRHNHWYPGFWGPDWWGWYGYPYYPYGYGYYDYDYSDWGPGYSYGPSYGDYGSDSASLAKDVQAELRRQGYYRGRIDGVIGPATREAIRSFQEDRGLPTTGRIDGALLHAMRFA
jgi:Putative peptidoglycan binding domain